MSVKSTQLLSTSYIKITFNSIHPSITTDPALFFNPDYIFPSVQRFFKLLTAVFILQRSAQNHWHIQIFTVLTVYFKSRLQQPDMEVAPIHRSLKQQKKEKKNNTAPWWHLKSRRYLQVCLCLHVHEHQTLEPVALKNKFSATLLVQHERRIIT